jgi:hypothetical protein
MNFQERKLATARSYLLAVLKQTFGGWDHVDAYDDPSAGHSGELVVVLRVGWKIFHAHLNEGVPDRLFPKRAKRRPPSFGWIRFRHRPRCPLCTGLMAKLDLRQESVPIHYQRRLVGFLEGLRTFSGTCENGCVLYAQSVKEPSRWRRSAK